MHDDDFNRLGAHKFVSHIAELFDHEERWALVHSWDGCGHAPIIGNLFNAWDDEDCFKTRRLACAALAAQKWFGEIGPPWARAIPLPVNIADCQKLEQDENLRLNLIGYYGFSLMMVRYDYLLHPPFADYVSGLMADKDTPDCLRADPDSKLFQELFQEFPPRPLEGLYVTC